MIDLARVPLKIGHYLAGFADGEGSFNIYFRPREDYKIPWKVSMCFNVSQKDKVILALFKRYLQCGILRSRSDGIWYFEVNNFNAIWENVIPFFKNFNFISAQKKRNFSKFTQIAKLFKDNQHLTNEGIQEILSIRRQMNDGGKRRYTDEMILSKFNKSSETTR